ncbi:MAG: hypothetical protein GY926_26360 [bacterium]|nr:hypothetical protein [bacterium]
MEQSASGDLASEVAEIWAEVLGVDNVDPDANFFDLGGHSLLAIRVMARVEERLGIDAPLVSLFQHPTPADFGAHYSAGPDTATPVPVNPETPLTAPIAPSHNLDEILAQLDRLTDDEAAQLLAILEDDAGGYPS